MNYELVKQLEEAGFPQEFKRGSWCCEEHGDDAEGKSCQCYGDMLSYIPTLSELIEECGGNNKTFILQHVMGKSHGWVCQRGNFIEKGITPEEAVARIWLVINKK